MNKTKKTFLIILLPIIILFLFIRINRPFARVSGVSMEPEFQDGQLVMIDKFFNYKVGDVVFIHPLEDIFEEGKWIGKVIQIKESTVSVGLYNSNTELKYFADVDKEKVIGKLIKF